MSKLKFLYQFYKVWKVFKHQRFGQLVINILAICNCKADIFYLQNDKFYKYLKQLASAKGRHKIAEKIREENENLENKRH